VLAAILLTLAQPPPPIAPLPNPNGYDALVKAGTMVTDNGSNYVTLGAEELRLIVQTNTDALKLARTGLSLPIRAPFDFSPTNETHIKGLAEMKRLARAFVAEGRLAELEHRPGEAAHDYLDAIRLGYAIGRGGLIIDSLVGIALQAIGMAPLEKLISTLDAQQCRELAAALETAESQQDSIESLLEQEHAWVRRTYGLKGRFIELIQYKSLKQTQQRWEQKVKTQQVRARVLIIQLAARAYELDKGERPRSLADLVPSYLKATPQDPVTGTNMLYRP
jgi:hypothetical protein